MLELAIALCGIIITLFLILIFSIMFKWKKARFIAGILMSIISLFTMRLFIYIQEANGNPDSGMEFEQFYFPLLVFTLFAAIGIISSIKVVKR